VVLVHPDVLAGAQATHEAVVHAAEQLLFLVRDADDRELREAVEVVDDAGVLQLVDLVKDDDGSRAAVLRSTSSSCGVDCRWMSMVAPRSSRIW
jgi:hypothetical protein